MDGLRIILGDNEELFIQGTVNILQRLGHTVIATDNSGTGLLRKIRAQHPDIVIADANLKGMSGFEISDVVEGEGICPCILTFKGSPSEYALKLQKKLVYSYIQKPINPEMLNYSIENAYYTFKKLFNLERKLKERRLVETAKGLLMEKYSMSEEEAFEYIRRKSMDKCTTMGRLAENIIRIINKNRTD